MDKNLRQLITDFIPPIFAHLHQKFLWKSGYFGKFTCWEDACRASSGYDSEEILNRVRDAVLKVKRGEAAYERDSVLFDKVQYCWPVLAGLLWIASRNRNNLNLVDFGGSLGSSYFQNKYFLSHLENLSWNIVEQKKFVDCGKSDFEDEHLRFYYDIDHCLSDQKPDTLLLLSVVQYLENPYEFLSQVLKGQFKYVIFDRTPFTASEDDMLTVHRVSPAIYRASIPTWLLSESKFRTFMSQKYELLADFNSFSRDYFRGNVVDLRGFLYVRRDEFR